MFRSLAEAIADMEQSKREVELRIKARAQNETNALPPATMEDLPLLAWLELRRQRRMVREPTESAQPWIGPVWSRREPPGRPVKAAWTSASMDRAIASGLSAPMSRPAG